MTWSEMVVHKAASRKEYTISHRITVHDGYLWTVAPEPSPRNRHPGTVTPEASPQNCPPASVAPEPSPWNRPPRNRHPRTVTPEPSPRKRHPGTFPPARSWSPVQGDDALTMREPLAARVAQHAYRLEMVLDDGGEARTVVFVYLHSTRSPSSAHSHSSSGQRTSRRRKTKCTEWKYFQRK